jgi:hypothetical protein
MVQAVVLLFETTLWFAILYFVVRNHITGVNGQGGAVDLSMRTMTTVGSNDAAHGATRFLVDIEPFIGLFFAGSVLARLVNAAPSFSDAAAHRAGTQSCG